MGRGSRGRGRALTVAYLVEADVRAAGRRVAFVLNKSAGQVIRESAAGRDHFDIFLSHSIVDEDIVLGVIEYLKQANLTTYVDWIVDPKLDRSRVDKATADALRRRMRQCDMLFYLWSKSAAASRWMPWELGYYDAYRGKIAVLPIVQGAGDSFVGTEFVGLYPVVQFSQIGSRQIVKVGSLEPKSWARGVLTAGENVT